MWHLNTTISVSPNLYINCSGGVTPTAPFLCANLVFLAVMCVWVPSFPGCDRNYHKRCAYKIPNNCNRVTTEAHAKSVHSVNVSAPPPLRHVKEVWSGRPLVPDRSVQGKLQVPHTFFVHSFRKPTTCNQCKKLVRYFNTVILTQIKIHLLRLLDCVI